MSYRRLMLACPVAGCGWTAGENPKDAADRSWWLVVNAVGDADARARAVTIYDRTHAMAAHPDLNPPPLPTVTLR